MSDLKTREAVSFVIGLTKKRQRLVLQLADQISMQPSKIGDYQTADAAGRPIENLRLEGYLFSYWIDHSSRQVRISDIVPL